MGTRDQEVAAEGGAGLVFDAKAMDAVDEQQGSILFVPTGVDLDENVSDASDRQLHAGARVDPGDRDHAGLGAKALFEAGDAGVGGRFGGIVVERDLAQRAAGAVGAVLERKSGDDVIVGRGEDLLTLG